MKNFIAIAAILLLSGCGDRISSSTIDAANYVCRNYGGVQDIYSFGRKTITCRTGKAFYGDEATTQYSEAFSGITQ